jgi:sn-glycerol 3-phosphate transport system permease protein
MDGRAPQRAPFDWLPHAAIIVGVLITVFPVYLAFVASTQTNQAIAQTPMSLLPGDQFFVNYRQVLFGPNAVLAMMVNSLAMALAITTGKIAISLLSAYAVVFFSFPGRMICFWMIFVTLMLPVEVRIAPTYQVVVNLGLINSFAGLTIPLIASATATLLFRQFFMTIPDELVEAAKIDGAGPLRFFWDTVLPLSRNSIAALFVILFIYGWNQYLWPLLITNSAEMDTIVIVIKKRIGGGDSLTEWNTVMATALLALIPPAVVVVLMQRWFVKGLVEGEK